MKRKRTTALGQQIIGELKSLVSDLKNSNTENYVADAFDAPPDSEQHRRVFHECWVGGSFIEGPYLLGRLTGRNFFRECNGQNVFREVEAIFIPALQAYLRGKISPLAIKAVTHIGGHDLAVTLLRREAVRELGLQYPGDPRHSEALFALAKKPSLSDAQLAKLTGLTEKGIRRITDVKHLRILMEQMKETRQ